MAETNGSTKRIIDFEVPEGQKRIKFDQEERAKKVVQETDVGITQYVNTLYQTKGGFFGKIKQRYSDFLVNEIDSNGKVVHLLDEGIDIGKTKKEKRLEKRQQVRADLQGKTPEEVEEIKLLKKEEEEKKPKYDLSEEIRGKMLELITSDELKAIEELFTTGNHFETTTKIEDKQSRGTLHQLFRSGFQNKLETVTTPENTFKIQIAKNDRKGGRRNPQESVNHVDENGVVNYGLGPYKHYLHFNVYKENRETMEVAGTIAKFLRIPYKLINFAGTKDRRGVTCQKFSIHKGKVVRVSSLNKGLKNAVLGGFSYEDSGLRLGDLKGNEFIITIRDVAPLNENEDLNNCVKTCFESLKDKGYINYYGLQRFGTFSVSTHQLGVLILNNKWKEAVELILAEQEVVAPDSIEARRIWAETKNASFALKKMPRRCQAEHSVLTKLSTEPFSGDGEFSSNSYFNSIMAIPRNLRVMYVHAYQSYVWNSVVSKRYELFGSEVQAGDLVLDDKKATATVEEDNDDDFKEDVYESNIVRARALTEEEVSSGKYTIFDVVLPTPGFDIVYPSNEQLRSVYVDVMAKDGLDPFKMGRRVREFSLPGSYRKIMGKPENLSYQIVKYNDEDAVVRTDLELLRAQPESLNRIIDNEEGTKTAVVLRMQLGVSSYATMALREFMKVDTSRLGSSMNVEQAD
ncbi:uncharacterized protein KQ657_004084 [Scheffersomyces spartinae]|uniref:TRUD domain-containing protein n=1 Tax=Scheffersomyces spartinae TaxID=45513 RepID=A0A9P7VBX7_9ASCO|nr:uncharacterized protein KQ657_004084 [Scheffersomyces spartinae]KAG7194973.1 hypothetical protein KQ657_004084 [Scheffersomyces spartinae]